MASQILVVNKKTHKPCSHDFYVGRPSVLGNPYIMHIGSKRMGHGTREQVVGMYDKWLHRMLIEAHYPIVRDINELLKKYQAGETIHLVCWCAPLECHADVIKKKIEDMATVINLYKGEST